MGMKIEIGTGNMEYFDFKCPYCKSGDIDLRPLGKSYTYRKDNDNTDIVDPYIRKQLDNIPYIGNILLNSSKEELLLECNKCHISSYVNDQIQRKDMIKYLKKNNIEPVLNLRR